MGEHDLACNAAANVAVGASLLTITLREEHAGCEQGLQLAGGLVSTIDTVAFLPGDYVEARVRVDTVDGPFANAGAFWTNGEDGPHDGEIDIVEFSRSGAAWNVHDPGRETAAGHDIR